MAQRITIIVSDLMFQPRIEAAARALGLGVAVPGAAPLGSAAIVIDLHETSLDAIAAIAEAKAAGARVLAFGRHTEPALLRAARDAGAEIVVPRSQLVEELLDLLQQLVGAPPS
jgi:DNA-binding NarL/FixJ family response regulator